ncbi:MAG: peptidase [Lysobacteraceae bacterium]|nr:MAG: peptidase [Xanthomonadaceae bacterium]
MPTDGRPFQSRAVALGLLLGLLATGLHAAPALVLPDRLQQGALAIGRTEPGARVRVDGREVRVSPEGVFLLAIGRDALGVRRVEVRTGEGRTHRQVVRVEPRDWPVEHVHGVPPKTVEPPPEIARRIDREQARVAAARDRDDARTDFLDGFAWPVAGRISGRFGARRSYDGKPGSPHSGMDIAAPRGTPVRAPAAGIVTFVDPDLYLTGGTLLIDHGHGLSSVFLHLDRIDVQPGQRVERGQPVATVGATGRASGPHLHWGVNWFGERLDPLLLPGLPPAP